MDTKKKIVDIAVTKTPDGETRWTVFGDDHIYLHFGFVYRKLCLLGRGKWEAGH